MSIDYFNELNVAVTISDKEGIIVYMNKKAIKTFESYGGEKLIGQSLFSCHNENSVKIIKELMAESKTNSYTIEKNGIKKMIYQTPHFVNGICEGLIEFSMEIPVEMPHFIRK